MPRSKRYAAYKYAWTRLINSLITSDQELVVDFPNERAAINQQQEWYSFLGALKYESERVANDPEQRKNFSDMRAHAQSILCRREGNQLKFIRKSATEEGKAIESAIEDQLGETAGLEFFQPEREEEGQSLPSSPSPPGGPPAGGHPPTDVQGEEEEDPYAAAMKRSGLDPDPDG